MEFKDAILLTLVIVAVIFVPMSAATMVSVNGLEKDLEEAEDDITYWKAEANRWEQNYINYECPECPNVTIEPIVIYKDRWHNDTIYETIWNNQTILVNNSICDVNRDGIVDTMDAAEILWYGRQPHPWLEEFIWERYGNPYEKLYDVNVDGYVNGNDVDFVLEHCD